MFFLPLCLAITRFPRSPPLPEVAGLPPWLCLLALCFDELKAPFLGAFPILPEGWWAQLISVFLRARDTGFGTLEYFWLWCCLLFPLLPCDPPPHPFTFSKCPPVMLPVPLSRFKKLRHGKTSWLFRLCCFPVSCPGSSQAQLYGLHL